MKNRIRKISIILVIFILCLFTTGCYDRRELDELAYPIAIGFDKGEGEFLRMSLQIVVPTKVSGGGEGGGGGETGGMGSVSVMTVETPTIYSGLNMVNTYVSKQLNLSHVKAIIFSEELAMEGIEKYINAISRGREFRGTAYVLVAKGTGNSAEKFIREVKPELESNPAKYYEMVLSAYGYTGFTPDATLMSFYWNMTSYTIQPIAVLANVNQFEQSEDITLEYSTYKQKGRDYPLSGDFTAGDMPKVGNLKTEVMGMAVFDGARMVGKMDGEETSYHLMVEGKYGYSYITVPDPEVKDLFVLLNMRQNRQPKKRVEMIGDNPQIEIDIKLEADILSIQSGINYESIEKIGVLEKSIEDFIKKGIERMLKRTAEEFGSDTLGIGETIKRKFLTWKQWTDFDWIQKYRNSSFTVNVDVKIRRPGHIIKTIPAYGTQKGE
jgi:spore germination protein KC